MVVCLHNSVREVVYNPRHQCIFMAMLVTNIRRFDRDTTEAELTRLKWAVVDSTDIRRLDNETFILDDNDHCIVIS